MTLAFDRASTRRYDADGRLHVAGAVLSKAIVSPYIGSEIPDAERLGLDPRRTYNLLRDPGELEKAAPTFAGLPLLSAHVPVSAEEPRPELVVGCIGSDARFQPPVLRASLVVWDGAAIAGIESEECRELSCGYRYQPDMTPGVYQGQRYDGRMTRISANHVALVPEGRVPGALVGDSRRPSPAAQRRRVHDMFPGLARIKVA